MSEPIHSGIGKILVEVMDEQRDALATARAEVNAVRRTLAAQRTALLALTAECDRLRDALQKYVDHFGDPLKCARAALTPERTVAGQDLRIDLGLTADGHVPGRTAAGQERRTVAAPASPLAPGRDRAAETCKHDRKIIRGNDYGSDLAWCDDCGEITWASDADWPDPITRKYSERVDWFKKRVIAFGCCKEAKPVDKWNDGKRCEIWCNHTYCPVSLKPAEISRLKGEGSDHE